MRSKLSGIHPAAHVLLYTIAFGPSMGRNEFFMDANVMKEFREKQRESISGNKQEYGGRYDNIR